MAGLKELFDSLLTKLAEVQFTNTIGDVKAPYVNVWNNQVDMMDQSITYPLPAVFLEISIDELQGIGENYNRGDVSIIFHIVNEMLDAGSGNYEQNLYAVQLRDSLRRSLRNFAPTDCSFMQYVNESPDYNHDNVYHYVMTYIAHWTDTTNSDFDATVPLYSETTPPTDLTITIE